jgi:type II secretory pathway pseudopilin PulG
MQQYATSQGVSAGVVQECAKLGVVQVRKHKDKTFIVDLPLDAYKTLRQPDEQKPEQIDTFAEAQKISGLINKILIPEQNTQAPTAKPIERKHKTVEPAKVLDLNIFAQEEERAVIYNADDADMGMGRFKIHPARKIADAMKIASLWKITAVIVTVLMLASVGAYFWANMARNAQQQKLQYAYENIQTLMKEYTNASQKTKMAELDKANWQSEASKNQKAVADLQTELLQTKEKLFQAQKDLSSTQQYNAETLRQLNQQINNITAKSQQP